MGLFSKNDTNPFEMFEEEFLIEFDAGSADSGQQEDELETIDADDPGDQGEQGDTEPEQEDEELETMDDEGETENQDDETQDDTTEGEPTDDTGEENPDDELETIDDDPDGMESGEEDTGSDDSSVDDGGMEMSENDPHQKLKELEAEIFDQLSDQEKEIKKNELKKLFIILIEKSDAIIDLFQEIPKTDETVRVIDYVINTLTDLKTYLNDYVVNMYDIKTYLQNTVNFQKYLAIFDSVKAITEEIKRTSEEK